MTLAITIKVLLVRTMQRDSRQWFRCDANCWLHVKFDRFFSWSGSVTQRHALLSELVSSSTSSHDDRYYDDADEAGFVYYSRLQRGIYYSRLYELASHPPSSFLFRSRITYFHVFYLVRHCCGHARATLFTVHHQPPSQSVATSIFYSASFSNHRRFLSYRAINGRQKNSIWNLFDGSLTEVSESSSEGRKGKRRKPIGEREIERHGLPWERGNKPEGSFVKGNKIKFYLVDGILTRTR